MASPSQLTEADENIPVDLQDTSFTITIEVPGTESFELQVWILNLNRNCCVDLRHRFIFRHQPLLTNIRPAYTQKKVHPLNFVVVLQCICCIDPMYICLFQA